MMSNNTDQKDPHVSIPIAPPTTAADTTPTTHLTKPFKSHDHHPENDSNTVEDPTSNTTTTTAPLPAIPQALHINTSHPAGGGIISNSAGRHHRSSSSSAFQEVDIASLRASTSDGGALSDPLTDPTFFNTARRHSSAPIGGFVLESPTMSSIPYEFEMQRFNAYDGSEPSTVKFVTTIIPAPSSKPTNSTTTTTTTTTTGGNSFFTGWMTVPPSLSGRPKLSQYQEDYIRREYERGPVPLMWAKNDDLENQTASASAAVTATEAAPAAATSSSWFGNWGFRSSSTSSTAGTEASITTPPRAAVAPTPSDSGRRETSQAP
ncbi:MAG: hypothetical protein JOS17DRAFT_731639 [Linnemannia elongata]|nr:MAG: hypothetical protein JOS17DRAFT_731639 [Linnemannia elongata]